METRLGIGLAVLLPPGIPRMTLANIVRSLAVLESDGKSFD
jgi:hypothetical protein